MASRSASSAVAKYRGKSTARVSARRTSRFPLAAGLRVRGVCSPGDELDVVHVHNLPDFLVFAGLLAAARRRKVVLDVHDSVPETFAAKFSGTAPSISAAALPRRAV